MIVLPKKYANEIKSHKQLSFAKNLEKVDLSFNRMKI